jgi:hypothetical protein
MIKIILIEIDIHVKCDTHKWRAPSNFADLHFKASIL